MPRELNESTLSLYFNKVDGKPVKMDVPAPKASLTSAEVKAQMDDIVTFGGLFDIASIKDAGITQRTVSGFAVEEEFHGDRHLSNRGGKPMEQFDLIPNNYHDTLTNLVKR